MKTEKVLRALGWFSVSVLVAVSWTAMLCALAAVGADFWGALARLTLLKTSITSLALAAIGATLCCEVYIFFLCFRSGFVSEIAPLLNRRRGGKSWPRYFLFFLPLTVASNFSEELICRGALLLVCAMFGTRWALIFLPLQALFWGIGHFSDDKYVQLAMSNPIAIRYYSLYLPVTGMMYGVVAMLTGSIIAPLAIHLGHNFFLYGYCVWFVGQKPQPRFCAPRAAP